MKLFFLSIVLFINTLHGFSQNSGDTQFYFIRHAEKVKDGSKDPLLTKKGQERALYWAEVFKNVEFDLVYSTQTSRTISTAKPSADKDSLEIQFYDHKKIDILALARNNPGKKILIVGHSNSTPTLVNNLIGENRYEEIAHSNNSNLYIVNYSPEKSDVSLLFIQLP